LFAANDDGWLWHAEDASILNAREPPKNSRNR
jgi:hypothetical protein